MGLPALSSAVRQGLFGWVVPHLCKAAGKDGGQLVTTPRGSPSRGLICWPSGRGWLGSGCWTKFMERRIGDLYRRVGVSWYVCRLRELQRNCKRVKQSWGVVPFFKYLYNIHWGLNETFALSFGQNRTDSLQKRPFQAFLFIPVHRSWFNEVKEATQLHPVSVLCSGVMYNKLQHDRKLRGDDDDGDSGWFYFNVRLWHHRTLQIYTHHWMMFSDLIFSSIKWQDSVTLVPLVGCHLKTPK